MARCNIACNIACNGVDTRCNCCVKCCRSRTCFYSCNIARNIARNVASCVRLTLLAQREFGRQKKSPDQISRLSGSRARRPDSGACNTSYILHYFLSKCHATTTTNPNPTPTHSERPFIINSPRGATHGICVCRNISCGSCSPTESHLTLITNSGGCIRRLARPQLNLRRRATKTMLLSNSMITS